MPYTPDATDLAQPADVGVLAATAAAEFRTIKTYMANILLASINLRAPLANPPFTGNGSITGNWAVSGNTSLGDAAADTLSISGVVVKNATNNWNIPAPSAGTTLSVAGLAATTVIEGTGSGVFVQSRDTGAAGAIARLKATNTVNVLDFTWTSTPVPGSIRHGDVEVFGISTNRNVSLAAPVSGYALTVPFSTPASSAATGVQGNISWDTNFIYVCTATNTWKRAALSTW